MAPTSSRRRNPRKTPRWSPDPALSRRPARDRTAAQDRPADILVMGIAGLDLLRDGDAFNWKIGQPALPGLPRNRTCSSRAKIDVNEPERTLDGISQRSAQHLAVINIAHSQINLATEDLWCVEPVNLIIFAIFKVPSAISDSTIRLESRLCLESNSARSKTLARSRRRWWTPFENL